MPESAATVIADAVAQQVITAGAAAPAPVADPAAPAAPVQAAPGAAGAPPPDPAAPAGTVDAQVEALRRENAQWRQRAQVVANIHPTDMQALAPMLDAISRGDYDTARQWMAAQLEPDDAPAAPATPAAPAPPSGPLTLADVERLVEERFQAKMAETTRSWQQEQARQEAVGKLNADLQASGLDPNSATAHAVVRLGHEMSMQQGRAVLIPEAFEAYKAELARFGLTPAQAAAAAAGAPPVGAPAPAGVAVVPDPTAGMTPDERAYYRLTGQRR